MKKCFRMASCICFLATLVIWFLPGSYSYNYLGGRCITSLFAFFPAPVLLPLILAGASIRNLTREQVPTGMTWTILVTAVILVIYLISIGCISTLGTTTRLQSLPLPLTAMGTASFTLGFRNPNKKSNIFQK